MEGSCSRLLEESTVCKCAFSYMSLPHDNCCCLRCSMHLLVCICVHIAVRLCCACIIHLSHIHADVIVDLLINNSMYICVSVAFVLFFSCELYYVVSRNTAAYLSPFVPNRLIIFLPIFC